LSSSIVQPDLIIIPIILVVAVAGFIRPIEKKTSHDQTGSQPADRSNHRRNIGSVINAGELWGRVINSVLIVATTWINLIDCYTGTVSIFDT
jgi:hypothetical protein